MTEKSVKIYVALKDPGNLTRRVKEQPFLLGRTPQTVSELIAESARACVAAYRERAVAAPAPLTEEQLAGMREVGKLAFGVHYNDKQIDEARAVEAALEAFRDGLVRVFCGVAELTDPEGEITVNEGDVFTFVRLTMLSGIM